MYKAYKQRLKLPKYQKAFIINLMHKSRNLYNEALYNVRQHFFNTKKYLSYNENYKTLSSTQAQMVIRKVDEAMRSFFGSLKAKRDKVKLPRYL